MSNTLSILICDDHQLIRDAIAQVLSAESDFEVETVASKTDLLAALGRGSYDVILLDVGLPDMPQLEEIADVVAAAGEGRVAIFTGNTASDLVKRCLDLGARGFIPKTLPLRALTSTIRLIDAGEVFVPVSYRNHDEMQPANPHMTDRESAVLRFLSKGRTNKEIARELGLSEVTVKMSVRNICMKLKSKNRTEAALIAQRDRLV